MTSARHSTDEAATPPHSDEAEQSVLGALLIDNAAFDRVGDVLQAGHFYHPEHRAIYSTISRLVLATKPADVITVFEAGGHELGYLNELAQSVPSARNVRGHAEIVQQRWRRRELARIGADLAADARNGTDDAADPSTLADRAVTALLALQQQGAGALEPQDIDALAVRFIDYVSELAEGKHPAIATGLADLDRLTGGGGRPGELWVIGARPSMGKTAITLAISRAVGQGLRVLMLTQEDSLNALMSRHVASAGRVNLADLRNPARAPDSMWHGLTEGVERLTPLAISMDDQAALTMADVRRKTQQVRRRHGRCDVVIIDYLQLMEGDEGENRNQKLGAIANGLKRLAKELGCWVILLSQMNREADKRPGPPQMGDLRDSGDIEGAADLIGLLYREWMRKPAPENKHHAELHVVKHKNGPTDTLHFYFDGAYQLFGNWDGPPPRGGTSRGAHAGGLE